MPREDLYVGDHDARLRRKHLLITAVVVAVLAVTAGFVALRMSSPPADGAASDDPSAGSSTTTGPGETAITEDADVVAAAIRDSSAEWRARVTEVSVVTVLRRPVVLVRSDLSGEEAQAAEELAAAISALVSSLGTPAGMPRTYYIKLLSAEGELVGALALTDARWTIDTPPPPSDAVGLSAWLEQVYGPSREPWLDAVKNIRGPAGEPDSALVVETTLDPSRPSDLLTAQTVFDAVNSSGATFASSIRLTFTDPTFEWTGVMDGVDPYAP